MKHYTTVCGVTAVAALSLTSCIDNNYDLSDIDTNSEFKVNNLVVPINMDAVKLDNIISLDEGSKIKKINGEYAFEDNGEFESGDIKINAIIADAPEISSSECSLRPTGTTSARRRAAGELVYDFEMQPSPFSYQMHDVDKSVHSLTHANVKKLRFHISVQVPQLKDKISRIEYRNLVIQLPQGLTATSDAGDYDSNTGRLTIKSLIGKGASTEINIDATAIDFKKPNGIDYNTHVFNYSSKLNILEGHVVFNPADLTGPMPSDLTFRVDYTLGDIDITSIDGEVEYSIDGMEIDPIDMTDIPDFLNKEGTNIFLAKPQLYLALTNPVAPYDGWFRAGIEISSYSDGHQNAIYPLNAPGYFEVLHNKQAGEYYNFCLTPSTNSQTDYPGYPDAKPVGYDNLTKVLSGNGIPQQLHVAVTDPMLPLQPVKGLPIGSTLGKASGHWTIYAPLALTPESTIIYTDRADGWGGEDLDKLTISDLEISATANSTLPIGAVLSGYPVDANGNRIADVEIEEVEIPAFAENQPIVIHARGTIRNLDGFEYRAVVKPKTSDALRPDQTITLTKLRARVSGTYVTDF